jgi:hypothetical protein
LNASPLRSALAKLRIQREGHFDPRLKLWTPEEEKLLGTDTDKAIARRLGRSALAVRARRASLGLPPIPINKPWREKELKLVGQMPDAEVARLTPHPLKAVQSKRHALGLRDLGSKKRPWSAVELKLLGTKSDEQVARMTGRTKKAVQARRVKARLAGRATRSEIKA